MLEPSGIYAGEKRGAMTRHLPRLIAALFAVPLIVVAAGAGLLAQPAGAAPKATLVVGQICSCTGPEASSLGQTTPIIQAWAKWVNGHGGVDGHSVRVIVMDDGYNPATSIADAHTLVSQDHVIALFDASDEDQAWDSYALAQHVPVLGAQSAIAGYSNPDFFPPGGTLNYLIQSQALLIRKIHQTKVADVYCVELAVCQQGAEQFGSALAKYGAKLVYSEGIGFAAPNFTAQCLAAMQAGAKVLEVGDATAIASKVAMDCVRQGYDPIQINSDGVVAISWLSIPSFNGNVDIEADIPWFVRNSATSEFYAALKKYAPNVLTSPNFGEAGLQTWVTGVEFQAAATGHIQATPTSADILAGLYAFRLNTLGGLSPALTFAKGHPASNSCFFTMGIKNGKFDTPFGLKTVCVK